MTMRPQDSKILASGNNNAMLDFIRKRLTYLLNVADPLPPYDTYLKTLRNDIWNEYNHLDVDEIQILIKNGLHEPEYAMFKHIIDTIKITERHGELDDKLKRIGKHAYTYRQMRTLWLLHYSFHAYINMLLHKKKDKFTPRELQEIYGASLMLQTVFNGIGNWRA